VRSASVTPRCAHRVELPHGVGPVQERDAVRRLREDYTDLTRRSAQKRCR
jgi:hypothetical protein